MAFFALQCSFGVEGLACRMALKSRAARDLKPKRPPSFVALNPTSYVIQRPSIASSLPRKPCRSNLEASARKTLGSLRYEPFLV